MHKFLFTYFFVLIAALYSFEPVIILLGPPGSGKGTFSQHLKECYGYNHISAGDLVRQQIKLQTPIGLEIEEIVKRGDYIPIPVMHSLIFSRIMDLASTGKPLIIDGFIRSDEDALFLFETLSQLDLLGNTFGLLLKADDDICRGRIASRQVCNHCYHVYNAQYAPATHVNSCDFCGMHLAERINDTPSVTDKRISEYRRWIGERQISSINSYPHFTFSTNVSLDECLNCYSQLAEEALNFQGDSSNFISGRRKTRPFTAEM